MFLWSGLEQVEVRCSNPLTGSFDLHLAGGVVRYWYVFDVLDLIAALDQLNGRAESPISG